MKERSYKSGSSVACAIVTGFISLTLSKVLNISNTNRLVNVSSAIYVINKSNLAMTNLNKNELISGLFNPEGFHRMFIELVSSSLHAPRFLNEVVDYNNNNLKTSFYATMQPLYFSLSLMNMHSHFVSTIDLDFHIENVDKSKIMDEYCLNIEAVDSTLR